MKFGDGMILALALKNRWNAKDLQSMISELSDPTLISGGFFHSNVHWFHVVPFYAYICSISCFESHLN